MLLYVIKFVIRKKHTVVHANIGAAVTVKNTNDSNSLELIEQFDFSFQEGSNISEMKLKYT